MSLASKITLGTGCAITLGTIFYVHYKQKADKDRMHEGVTRDIERQQKRKVENLYWLQQQIELGKVLKKQASDEETVLQQLLESPKSSSRT